MGSRRYQLDYNHDPGAQRRPNRNSADSQPREQFQMREGFMEDDPVKGSAIRQRARTRAAPSLDTATMMSAVAMMR